MERAGSSRHPPRAPPEPLLRWGARPSRGGRRLSSGAFALQSGGVTAAGLRKTGEARTERGGLRSSGPPAPPPAFPRRPHRADMDRFFRTLLPFYRAIARCAARVRARRARLRRGGRGVRAPPRHRQRPRQPAAPRFPVGAGHRETARHRRQRGRGGRGRGVARPRRLRPLRRGAHPRAMALRGKDGTPYFARYEFRRDTRFMQRNASTSPPTPNSTRSRTTCGSSACGRA